MLSFVRRNFLSIDPRTLGLLRIAIAILLLVDLAKRATFLRLFYTNAGLLPNHRILWRPPRERMFSPLFALSDAGEVQVAFALIGLIYLCFLLGYRTRVMHVLAWISLASLQVRAEILGNGGDTVFCELVLWTTFLPLGRRLSVDAVLHSLRRGNDTELASVRPARDTRPVLSLAVLALHVQLAVIYYFNCVQKTGGNWRDGTAVYWLVHQERIVTTLGLWARQTLPLWTFKGLTYATLVLEGVLPLLILLPWGRPWTRRAAIVCIVLLHGGIALMSNLGLFSPVMMAFALSLIDARDWDAWAQRARRSLTLAVDVSSGLCFQAARLWARLDTWGCIELRALDESNAADGCGFVQTADGRRYEHEPALRRLLGVLPLGPLLVAAAQLLRPITAPCVRWAGRNRAAISRELALRPAGVNPLVQPPAAAFTGKLRRLRFWGCELAVLALVLVATSQLLNDNRAVPKVLEHEPPQVVHVIADYARLIQGWSMFAPRAPKTDRHIVIDAITRDGRHVDPWNEIASRVSDPSLRTIPERLGHDTAYCQYSRAIPDEEVLHEPLRDWIMSYHERTHRPADRIQHFKAYVIEQDSPPPGGSERGPGNVRARVFLEDE